MSTYEFLLALGFWQWFGVLALAGMGTAVLIVCVCGMADTLSSPFRRKITKVIKESKGKD